MLEFVDFSISAGGTAQVNGNHFRNRVGIFEGQEIDLEILADNIDFINRLGDSTRWITMADYGIVPFDYRWTCWLSMGNCDSISDGRRVVIKSAPKGELLGRMDFILLLHLRQEDGQQMKVIALFESEEDAVLYRLMTETVDQYFI